MSKDSKLVHVSNLALLAALILIVSSTQQGSSFILGPNDFDGAHRLALELESASLLLLQNKPTKESTRQRREEVLTHFVRDPKTEWCKSKLTSVSSISEHFRKAAIELIEYSKTSKGWLTNLVKLGGPMFHVRGYARFLPGIESLPDRYEKQAKDGKLTLENIDCDIKKSHLKTIHSILFLLSTDIKYLVIGDQRILNQAIFERLMRDKLASEKNLYNLVKVNGEHKTLLTSYFINHVDTSKIDVGTLADHVSDPSEYIMGRLLDSCQAVDSFKENLAQVESDSQQVCSETSAGSRGQIFESSSPSDRYSETFQFCQFFLNALTPDEAL